MAKIRVVLAEDYPVVRIGLKNLIKQTSDIEVVGEAENGVDAVRITEVEKPDVLLLDMELPGMDGVDVIRKLRSDKIPIKILVLSAYQEKKYVQTLLESGVSGYLLKEEAAEKVIDAIRSISNGEKGWISKDVVEILDTSTPPRASTLTPRETTILNLLVKGMTNQAIANQLKISIKTIEKHMSSIFSKLGVNSRTDAAVMAVREKLV